MKREWEVVLHKRERETIVRRKKRGEKNVCVETLYIYIYMLLCYLKVFFPSLIGANPLALSSSALPSQLGRV